MAERNLKVLQLCSAREAIYGAVQSLMTLAKAQKESGTHVEFLTFKGKKFGEQVRAAGFPVHEVKVRGKIDPVAILQMRKVIREGRFDVVHTHLSTSSVNGTLAARLAKVPSVATVHGMSGKLSFAAATHLISVSEGVKNHLVQQGVSAKKITVVYNGLPSDFRQTDRAVRLQFGMDDSQIVLGTVSRITPLKGIDDAINAIHLLKDHSNLQYLLVGDGDAVAECQALAASLGLKDRVHFAGYQTDVARYLAAMDLFVFPSHKEAMGIALVEAMAQGLPIVATNIGGIPEVVNRDCGLLVADANPPELAGAIQQLLDSRELRTSMSEAAMKRVSEVFSVEAMLQGTDEVYRLLLS